MHPSEPNARNEGPAPAERSDPVEQSAPAATPPASAKPDSAATRWSALDRRDGLPPDRFGWKAHRLAALHQAGVATPGGWALDAAATASAARDPREALALAGALLESDPDIALWMVRSSSPAEDRDGASLAGLLESRSANATPEALAQALAAVGASGGSSLVQRVLELPAGGGLAVAVLAQRHLELRAWWTVEVHPDANVLQLEGWSAQAEPVRALRAQLLCEELAVGSAAGPPWARAALSLTQQALAHLGPGAWQLEIGEERDRVLLLQARPAPARWSAWGASGPARLAMDVVPAAGAAPALAGAREDVPHFPLHPQDAREHWAWDAEHCPTPLCPLLAGWFARWLAAQPAGFGSRLIDGRWHDRTRPTDDEAGAGSGSAERVAPPAAWAIPESVQGALREWTTRREPALLTRLAALERAAAALAGPLSATQRRSGWREFMGAWLLLQQTYFSGGLRRARGWARQALDALRGLAPKAPAPPLPQTEAAQRETALQELVALARCCFPEDGPPPSPGSIAALLDPAAAPALPAAALARTGVIDHLRRFGHVAVAPWDGRAAALEEDRWPLWAELARRLAGRCDPGPAFVPAAVSAQQRRAQLDAALESALPDTQEREAARAAAETAARVLAACEDDDTLLARAYALWRRAARALAQGVTASASAQREIFDLLPGDLDRILVAPPAEQPRLWRESLRRGRALAAVWEGRTPADAVRAEPSARPGPGRAGEQRLGLPASPGRAQGAPRRLDSAQQDGGPAAGEILVVPMLLPADAVVLGRVAAVVAESGGALSHAAVLARERGVPAVVALPKARRWLACAREVLVDGDRGTVTILRD
jgi:phosphohistidine swiveling domain-containing protein